MQYEICIQRCSIVVSETRYSAVRNVHENLFLRIITLKEYTLEIAMESCRSQALRHVSFKVVCSVS